jgi:hypothetical protein
MKRSRFTDEQIGYALRQVEGGTAMGDMCRVNGKLRDECLNAKQFLSIDDARSKIEALRTDYNLYRPDSGLGNVSPAEWLKSAKKAGRSSHRGRRVRNLRSAIQSSSSRVSAAMISATAREMPRSAPAAVRSGGQGRRSLAARYAPSGTSTALSSRVSFAGVETFLRRRTIRRVSKHCHSALGCVV